MSRRSGDAPLSVAFHIDQLWFSAPGGIGTYVRQLGTELERSDQVVLTPFRSRWKHEAAGVPATAVPIVITGTPARTAYLGWSVARRPKLPHALDGCRVVHATNPATIPPIRDGQSLVVTIHDLTFEDEPDAFPATWLRLYRRGLDIARKEAAIVLVPSEYVGGRLRERGIAADRLRVTPLAGMPLPVPAPTLPPEAVVQRAGHRRSLPGLGRNVRAAQEPGAVGPCLSPGGHGCPPPPRAGAGGASGVAHR